ncbi:hypothetical protein ACHAWF_005235 [Thalassiosira exigua]
MVDNSASARPSTILAAAALVLLTLETRSPGPRPLCSTYLASTLRRPTSTLAGHLSILAAGAGSAAGESASASAAPAAAYSSSAGGGAARTSSARGGRGRPTDLAVLGGGRLGRLGGAGSAQQRRGRRNRRSTRRPAGHGGSSPPRTTAMTDRGAVLPSVVSQRARLLFHHSSTQSSLLAFRMQRGGVRRRRPLGCVRRGRDGPVDMPRGRIFQFNFPHWRGEANHRYNR